MKERPILFSGDMVRAILAGEKTQTRRVAKIQPMDWSKTYFRCPYGQPGDRLWVRETFMPLTKGYAYRADNLINEKFPGTKWKPSIFMPRKANRIMLEITNIRVERLQEITPSDYRNEGINIFYPAGMNSLDIESMLKQRWIDLWDSINLKRGQGWNKNPWVWVIEFKRVSNG